MSHTLSRAHTFRSVLIASALFCAIIMLFAFVSADSSSALLPMSGGTYAQWTPKSGTTHYTMVDESTCNGTTDYNYTTIVGNRDSYGVSLSSVPDGAVITSVAIVPCASRNATGSTNPIMNVFYRFGGVNSADAGNYSLTGTTPTARATTTFSSLSLLKMSSSTLEVGAVLTSGVKGVRLSRIATVLTYTTLGAPTSLAAIATTTSSARLTWTDNATTESGFAIDRSLDGSTWTTIASTSANVTEYNDTGLSAETTYYYRTRAFNAGGYSTYSNTASTTTAIAAPAAPSSLVATATTTSSASLSWTDGSTNETGFVIDRSPNGSSWTTIASTSANVTDYNDSGLNPSTTYYYRTRAFNAGGYSTYSDVATATTALALPAAPSGLSVYASSTAPVVYVSWTNNATNNTSIELVRSDNGGVDFFHIATTSASSTFYIDTAVSGGTSYAYKVRAYNAAGYSAFSDVASTTTYTAPEAPSDLILSLTRVGTTTTASLNWTDNSYYTSFFEVQRAFATTTFSHQATTTRGSPFYTEYLFGSGLDIAYRVRAYNGYGYSDFSNVVATTTP